MGQVVNMAQAIKHKEDTKQALELLEQLRKLYAFREMDGKKVSYDDIAKTVIWTLHEFVI